MKLGALCLPRGLAVQRCFMKFWGKFCALLLILAMLPAFPASVFAVEEYYGEFGYEKINSNTAVKIVAYYGLGGPVVVPNEIEGLPVTTIPTGAIVGIEDSQITALSLPANLVHFSARSLVNCDAIASLTVDPANPAFKSENDMLLTKDGTHVVLYPAAHPATRAVIPEGVTDLDALAFFGAANLVSVHFPSTLARIAGGAQYGVFENCSSLETVQFPTSIVSVGNYAFTSCTALKEVNFFEFGSLSIGINAFFNCPSLTSVMLLDNVNSIGAEAFGFLPNPENPAVSHRVEGFTLFGYNGTKAKKYATDNGFNYVLASLLTDLFNDVKLTGDAQSLPNATAFSAPVCGTSSAEYLAAARLLLGANRIQVRNFSVTANPPLSGALAHAVRFNAPRPAFDMEKTVALYFTGNGFTYLPATPLEDSDWLGNPASRILYSGDSLGVYVLCESTYAAGDVSADHVVGVDDLTLLAKQIAGWNVSGNFLAMDVTGDASVNMDDLTLLAKSIAGWNVSLTPFAGALFA